MSRTKDDGGSAFPLPSVVASISPGMSLRDWFAGQVIGAVIQRSPHDRKTIPGGNPTQWWAGLAYEMADAMLAERVKVQSK